MARISITFLIVVMAAGPAAAQSLVQRTPRVSEPVASSPVTLRLQALDQAKLQALQGLVAKDEETCVIMGIECGETHDGVIATTDCALDDGTYVDFWTFDGTAGTEVTIDLESDDFDTFLFLLDPTPEVVVVDDDGGTGTNSRLVHTLDVSGEWSIAANNFAPGDHGAYTLSLTCENETTQPPAAPSDLAATAVNTDEVDLTWQDNSDNEDEFRVEITSGTGTFVDLGATPADNTSVAVTGLDAGTTYAFRVRARNSAGDSDYSNEAKATTPADTEPCVADAETMCLNGGRFKVQMDWRDFDDNTGTGKVVSFGSDDSGLFYFFSEANWEVLVKVLNGCPFNQHYWVFAAATTNVEYTLRVTDTENGTVNTWMNALGVTSPAITDTQAFATCD